MRKNLVYLYRNILVQKESRNHIKSIIIEVLNSPGLINEDFQSIKEIRDFSSKILYYLAQKNLKIIKNKNFKEHGYFESARLYDVYTSMKQKDKEALKVLVPFIKESTDLYVSISRRGENLSKGIKGQYSVVMDKKFNPNLPRNIFLYYDQDFIDEIERIKERKPEVFDLYSKFYYSFGSYLIHELQHAYDDYRSKGKIYTSSKQFEKFRELSQKLENMVASEENTDKRKHLTSLRDKMYLNLPSEIWARFSQTMEKLRFIKSDMLEDDKGHYWHEEMRSLKEIIDSLRYMFDGWRLLTEKMRRSLINRISQFWYLEQEKVKENMKTRKYIN